MSGPSQGALLVAIGVLAVIWWATRPDDISNTFDVTAPPAELQGPTLPEASERAEGLSWKTGPGGEPSWLKNVDDTRPECRKMRRELIEAAASGELSDMIYIGDCDTRLP